MTSGSAKSSTSGLRPGLRCTSTPSRIRSPAIPIRRRTPALPFDGIMIASCSVPACITLGASSPKRSGKPTNTSAPSTTCESAEIGCITVPLIQSIGNRSKLISKIFVNHSFQSHTCADVFEVPDEPIKISRRSKLARARRVGTHDNVLE